MTALIIGLSILLLVIVILQISKLTDMYARIRGEEEVEERIRVRSEPEIHRTHQQPLARRGPFAKVNHQVVGRSGRVR